MKEKLKKQNGLGLVAMILVVVAVIAVVGVGALTVRMVVTGEEFLAPIEEFFGSEEADEEDEDDEVKKEKDNDKVNNEEEEKNNTTDEDDDVVHYHGEIDFEDYTGGSTLEYSDLIDMNADIYATETEIVEIVFEFDLKAFLENYYEAYEDDMVSAGYDTYESFRDEMMDTFETSFASGFATSGSEVSDYFEIDHPEEEIIEMHITEGGIEQIYENYGIEQGDSVQDILDGFEDALSIELEEV